MKIYSTINDSRSLMIGYKVMSISTKQKVKNAKGVVAFNE